MTFRMTTTAAATLTAALTASTGFAQTAFQDIDTNANGMLAVEEIRVAYGDQTETVLTKYDMNGDGMVTRDEVRATSDQTDMDMQTADQMDPMPQSDDASASDLAENIAGEELTRPVGDAAD